MSWRSTLEEIREYNVTITGSVSAATRRSQMYSIIIQVPRNETELEIGNLCPQQNYSVCVTAVLEKEKKASSCRNIQMPPQMPPQMPQSSLPILLKGIFGSIITLLLLLLIVAGVGLAYPCCIRSRVKDKKYFSR